MTSQTACAKALLNANATSDFKNRSNFLIKNPHKTSVIACSSLKNKLLISMLMVTSLLLFNNMSFAQTSDKYAFFTSGSASLSVDRWGTAIDMSTGTTQLVASGQDDAASNVTNIGFTFPFMGANQTQFSASSNGIIKLGNTRIATNLYSLPSTTQLLIAPYAGDLATASNGKVHFKVFGASPNRVLVVEFQNMEINYSSTSANGTFQARLYESGIIEFVYGNMAVGGTTNNTIRIGFSQNTSTNNVFTVNQSNYSTSTTSTLITNTNSSTGIITGLNSAADGSRRNFTFIPNGYKSQFISISYGSGTWCAGEARDVTVVVKNVGTDSWSDVGKDINVGLKWNVDGDYGGAPSYIQRQDADGLLPGATGTYVFPGVIPPAGVTTENLTSDIVYEAVSWFGNNNSFVGPGNTVLKSANITVSPLPTAVNVVGGTGCGSVTVTASGGTGGTMYYQGTTSGGTSTAVASSSQSVTSSGTYYFRSRSAAGCWSSEGSALVTINSQPVISTNPVSQTKCTGSAVTFSVTATGTNLTYQWRKNSANISGATSGTFTINSLFATDAANYDVIVSSAGCTSVTSTAAALTVNSAPVISAQPQSVTLCAGATATFSVTSSGTPAPTYQWMKGGVDISGATSSTYSIPAITTADAAAYSVKVINSCSTVVSNVANLNVNTAPVVTVVPVSQTKCSGSSVTFSVTATGSNLTYQWRKNSSNISGATTSSYTISSVAPADAANYDVVVSNVGCTSATSAAATLTVNLAPSISAQPQSATLCEGATATFNVTASGTPAPTYQWMKGGVDISGATSSTFSIPSITTSDAASYSVKVINSCSTVVSNAANLNVNTAPVVTVVPVSQIICSGSSVTFSVTATGSNLTYQWRKNSSNISGATTSSYTISSVAPADAGNYDVVVSNVGCTSVTSVAATLTVNVAPSISAQPQPATLCEGSTANFSVTASGTPSPTYQWKKNGVDISGATSASFSITSLSVTDAATYSVNVINSCSTVVSNNAILNVNIAPVVTVDPVSQTKCSGSSVTFSVTATGSNLTYQWRKNSSNISGATSSSYSISSVAPGDAANYDVVVSNVGCTTATSAAAILTVNVAPSISAQPQPIILCEGATANFSVTASGTPSPTYQWQKGGVDISGATSSTLSISNINPSDASTYRVIITNSCGILNSNNAALTVNTPPSISSQPTNQVTCAGSGFTLSVVAAGTNVSYQWRKGGVNISGATSATYTVANAATSNSGNYDVVLSVANCSSLTSFAVSVTVNSRPTANITSNGTTICSLSATSVTGNVTASGAWTLTLSDGQQKTGTGNSTFSFTVNPANATTYTLTALTDALCTSNSADLTGSTTVTTSPLPSAVSVTPATQTICNGASANLGGAGNVTQNGTAFSDNFNGATGFTSAGTSSGNRSQIWSSETSGSNVNSNGTYTSPNGGKLMIAMSSATAIFGQSTSSVNSTLTSPAISTNSFTSLTLTFQHTYNKANTSGSANVEVSNNGTTWTSIKSYTGNVGGATSFASESINIPSQFVNQNLYIRFNYVAAGTSSFLGSHNYWWGVDDVALNGNLVPFYSWTASTGTGINGLPAGAATPSVANKNITVSPSLSTDYTMIVTNPITGCSSNSVSSVLVNSRPTGVLSGSYTYCRGENTTSALTLTVTGSGTISGTLSDGTSFSGTAPEITVNVNPTNSTAYTISSLVDANCTSIPADLSGTANVTVNERPTGVLSGEAAYCIGASTTTQLSIAVTGTGTISGTLSDGTPFSGTAPTINVNVTPVATTTYTIATMSDASCTSNGSDFSGSATVTVNPLIPVSVSIESSDADNTICDGSSVTFTATPVNGGNAHYRWLLNNNNVGNDQNTFTTSGLINGDAVKVELISDVTPCAINNPATSNEIITTVNANQPVSVSITSSDSDNTICDGTSVTFTAVPVNGGPEPVYHWILNGNIVGSNEATFTTNALTNNDAVSVILTSNITPCATGNPATSNSIVTTVNANQPVSITISTATTMSCAGKPVLFTSDIINGGNNPAYQWFLNGVAITDSISSTITLSTLVDGDVVTATLTSNISPCATGNPATSNGLTMNIGEIPPMPGPITGPLNVCPYTDTNIPITYSIDPVQGATSYTWTLPVGATLVSGQGTTSITVTVDNSFALTHSRFRVVSNNSFPCSSEQSILEVFKLVPEIPTAITGSTSVCAFVGNQQVITYNIATVANATSYTWETSNGISIVGGQGTTSLQVNFDQSFVRGSLKVTANSNCGSRSARSLNISADKPQAPAAISGPVNACPYLGQIGGATYSVSQVPNATSYMWTIPAGCSIISGQGTASIILGFSAGYQTGILKVKSVSSCYTSGDRNLTISSSTYGAPGPITGPTNACQYLGTSQTATYYINKVVNAPAYAWTVPAGCTIVDHPGGNGENDTLIKVTFPNNFVSGGTISVKATGCFTTTESTISILRSPGSSMPGLISGPTNACEFMQSANNDGSSYATYTIRKVNSATSYVWSVNGGGTILSHPGGSGINDTIVTVLFNSDFVPGSVSVSSSNGCGISDSRVLRLSILNPRSPGAISMSQTQTCPMREFVYSLSQMPGQSTSIQWTVPAGATIISGQGTTSITVSYPMNAISGVVSATPHNNCSQGSTSELKVNMGICAPGFAGKTDLKMESESGELKVNIYPNPSNYEFKLKIKSSVNEKVSVRVIDIMGREILKGEFSPEEIFTFGKNLRNGIYFVEARQGKLKSTSKIVRN